MSFMYKFVFALISLLFSITVCSESANELPFDLIYHGKPIDPLCLFETVDTSRFAKLKTCGIHAIRGRSISGENKKLISEGFVGYNYTGDTGGANNTQCYSYYKAFGTYGDAVIVQMMNNSGGSGQFSSLSLVKRQGKRIKVSPLVGGDRCNGGVVDVRRMDEGANSHLIYSTHLTAYDFLTLAHDNPHHLKAYRDLASCAVCCVAKAVFQQDLASDVAKEKLLYVEYGAHSQDAGQSSSEPRYQACFDKLLDSYRQTYPTKMNIKQLKQFTHQFNAQCIGE